MKPTTAKEIVLSLPERIKKEKAIDQEYEASVHLFLEGEDGGDFTVNVSNGVCSVIEGIEGDAICEVKAKASTYADLEWGRINPQMALMMGKVKASNVMALVVFTGMFRTLEKVYGGE